MGGGQYRDGIEPETLVDQQTIRPIVRYRRGRGWNYREFPDKEKASEFIIYLDSNGFEYQAFVKKSVRIKTVFIW